VRGADIVVYVLVGYDTTLEEDLRRFERLRELGVRPFAMPYDGGDHPMRRWGQRPKIYMSVPLREYLRLRGEGYAHPEEEYWRRRGAGR
jgi:hypothetical protein